MFAGFERFRVETEGASINAVSRGEGPPVLLCSAAASRCSRCGSSIAPRLAEKDRRLFEEVGVALYCYCSIKKREVNSIDARRYLDCGGFAHRGCVYRLSRSWSRHLRLLLIRVFTTARLRAKERGDTEHERRVHIAGLRVTALAAGTEIVAATTTALTRQKFRETNLLDRINVVDDPRTPPAMVRHLISAHAHFLGG
jgi:hypothetical protein